MEEKIYPLPESPYDVINLVHWMKPEILDSITQKCVKFRSIQIPIGIK